MADHLIPAVHKDFKDFVRDGDSSVPVLKEMALSSIELFGRHERQHGGVGIVNDIASGTLDDGVEIYAFVITGVCRRAKFQDSMAEILRRLEAGLKDSGME